MDPGRQDLQRQFLVDVLAPIPVDQHRGASGDVDGSYGGVGDVAVLPSGTRSPLGRDLHVLGVEAGPARCRWQDGDGYSGGVDPAALLRRGDALPAVPTGLLAEDALQLGFRAFDREDRQARRSVLDR